MFHNHKNKFKIRIRPNTRRNQNRENSKHPDSLAVLLNSIAAPIKFIITTKLYSINRYNSPPRSMVHQLESSDI